MKTRLYSEGRNDVLGERWFTACYAVPIFSREAVLRWLQSKAQVNNPGEGQSFRLLRVRTLMQMEK